jgi:hypothetical protein
MPYVSTKLEYVGQLVVLTCWSCSIHYGVPKDFRQRRREDGNTFYCPNGHGAVFSETELQRVRRELDYARDAAALERSMHDQTLGTLRATRGVVTKLRKRVTAGSCPFGCHRHFANLERHVATKHPGAALEGES